MIILIIKIMTGIHIAANASHSLQYYKDDDEKNDDNDDNDKTNNKNDDSSTYQ